jgi:plasmid stabilization system protein ParE
LPLVLTIIVRAIIFTRDARAELIEAQSWYENEAPGLGRRFRAAVDAEVERMRANPRQFPAIHKNIRRALLSRFPYALMYVIEPDEALTVIACFHGSRDPARWQLRV